MRDEIERDMKEREIERRKMRDDREREIKIEREQKRKIYDKGRGK